MSVVSVVCLSGRGLCDELITRPEESYQLCCVVVHDLETSRIGAPYIYIYIYIYDISSLRVNITKNKNTATSFMQLSAFKITKWGVPPPPYFRRINLFF